MSLGAGARKEVSMATLKAANTKVTVTLNAVSGILTKGGGGGEGKKA